MQTNYETHGILTPLQHGFRAGHSCESQLLLTTEDLVQNYDDKIQTDVIVLDFSKAFDVVPHCRLLHKLEHYGIRGKTLLWIQNFLTTRTQKVLVDGSSSGTAHVKSGVPQGTVLGPLLFLTYINYLPDCVSSQTRLFADDCLLYRPIKSEADQVLLQEDLSKLQSWADIWCMNFNPSKCSVLRVARPRSPKLHFDYTLKGQTLERVPHIPYLGVELSESLEWESHVNKIAAKANSTLGFLRRNLRVCPLKLKETAYFAMVCSTSEYSSAVWDPYLEYDIDKLSKIERAAA